MAGEGVYLISFKGTGIFLYFFPVESYLMTEYHFRVKSCWKSLQISIIYKMFQSSYKHQQIHIQFIMEMVRSSLDSAVWVKDHEQYYFWKPVKNHLGFITTNPIFSVSHLLEQSLQKLLLEPSGKKLFDKMSNSGPKRIISLDRKRLSFVRGERRESGRIK